MESNVRRKALFLLLSFVLHLFLFLFSNKIPNLEKPFWQLLKKHKKKERIVYVKILNIPKPKKEEKPLEKNTPIISQFNTRKKGPLGKQEESMLSGESPVLKPQPGFPIKIAPAPVAKAKPQPKPKKQGSENKPATKKKVAKKAPKGLGKKKIAKVKTAKEQKKKLAKKKTVVKLKSKVAKIPLPPLPERKLPLIDPRLVSELSKKIVPQMGQGQSVEISLDTTTSKYISYFKHIRDKIYLVWRYPPEAAAAGISGVVKILFVIGRDGYLKDVRILESSGHPVLDKAAVNAIFEAAPFGPFPKDWTEKELRIRARFIYTLYTRSPF